jgi:hypothetical protein
MSQPALRDILLRLAERLEKFHPWADKTTLKTVAAEIRELVKEIDAEY